MKIAAATNDNINITGHAGRCKAFIIFDVNDSEILSTEIRNNSFTHHSHEMHAHHQHNVEGHNHSHNRLIDALHDCSYIFFQGGGWRLIDDLKANNITPVLTSENIAEEAVKKFLKGELKNESDLTCRCHQ